MTDFQNPHQNEPGTERRLLLTFAFTFIVIFITQQFMTRYAKPPAAPAKPAPTQAAPPQTSPQQPAVSASTQSTTSPASTKSTRSKNAANHSAKPLPELPAAAKQANGESETVIENDLYRITFSNRGGVAKSWVLKKYKDDKRHPLELINTIAATKYGYPLSLYSYDQGLRDKINQALYVPTETGSGADKTLSFEFSDGDLSVTKKFSFSHSYEVRIETSVTQKGSMVSAYPEWPAGFGDETVVSSYNASRIDYFVNDKIERVAYKKVAGGATINGPFNWGGASDQYFAAVFLPDDPERAAMVTFHNDIQIPKNLDKPDPKDMEHVPVLGAAVGSPDGATSERIFVGPKALDVISDVHAYDVAAAPGTPPNGPTLEKLVDFGTFSFFAKWLFLWLRWTYEHWVGNYGWAILILTLIIYAALLPLRFSTIKSAMRMQKLQPQVNAINAKYKKYKLTDPRQAEKNKELQALYKQEGVNPLGGCLPNLVQLPFLWAFYTMLQSAIELRHANWMWLHDLSGADPTHIISIIFIASMFLMQQITPQAGMDPAQQKMMKFTMPLLLGIFTWNLSAGLGLYWAASNVLGIVQQVGFNQTKLGREMRTAISKRTQKRR